MEEDYISVYEYEKNVNPYLNDVLFYEQDINECNYGITMIDFTNVFNVFYVKQLYFCTLYLCTKFCY